MTLPRVLPCTVVLAVVLLTGHVPASAEVGDGLIDVLIVKDVDFDGVYTPGVDLPQADIPVTLADAHGRRLFTGTDSLGHTGFNPAGADLSGGRYRVEAFGNGPPQGVLRPASFGGVPTTPGAVSLSSWVAFVDVRGGAHADVIIGVVDPDDIPVADPTPVQIGGRVWLDDSPEGLQQPGEPPTPGIVCELRAGYRAAGDVPLATTVTDELGEYAFFIPAQKSFTVTCRVPAGFTPTAKRAVEAPTVDSDGDPDGSMGVRGHRRGVNDATYDLGLVPVP
ncbi:MAG: hypothetical protein HOV79_01640 [Hamadaea sp.]|nr:hypothetical protein [Hamadaea sp.]